MINRKGDKAAVAALIAVHEEVMVMMRPRLTGALINLAYEDLLRRSDDALERCKVSLDGTK